MRSWRLAFGLAVAASIACASRTTMANGDGLAAPSIRPLPIPMKKAPSAPPAPALVRGAWTPARVRAFVLRVEAVMERLEDLQFPEDWDKRAPLRVGTCHDEPIAGVISRSFVMEREQVVLSGRALVCYTATYLGCTIGKQIGRSIASASGPVTKPFTRSKVTIVEQSPDRVVADVVEADFEQVHNGVIGDWDDAISAYVEYTDEVLVQYKEVSRYTITRGSDGVWRVSDRKPPFVWECRSN